MIRPLLILLALAACYKPAPLEERIAQGCPDTFDVECQKAINKQRDAECQKRGDFVYVRGIMGTDACVLGFRL